MLRSLQQIMQTRALFGFEKYLPQVLLKSQRHQLNSRNLNLSTRLVFLGFHFHFWRLTVRFLINYLLHVVLYFHPLCYVSVLILSPSLFNTYKRFWICTCGWVFEWKITSQIKRLQLNRKHYVACEWSCGLGIPWFCFWGDVMWSSCLNFLRLIEEFLQRLGWQTRAVRSERRTTSNPHLSSSGVRQHLLREPTVWTFKNVLAHYVLLLDKTADDNTFAVGISSFSS